MKNFFLTSLFVLLVCGLGQTLIAQTFSVQGVLRDPLGKTVKDGTYSVTFRLYDAAASGTKLWEETQASMQILHGVVTGELGTVNSLSPVPFDKTYFLGVSVDGGQELEPRFKLTKTPSAMSVQGTNNVFPSHGNIGAGTVTPAAGLHIKTNASADDLLKIESSQTNGGFIKVLADGKMGVNVATPTQAFDITGNINLRTGSILFSDGSSLSSAEFGGSASSLSNPTNSIITSDANKNGAGELQIINGNTTRMVVKNDGKVGIGTTAPAYPLDVVGDINSSGKYRGDGSLLASLNATNIASGTLDNARLDADLQDLADGSLSGSKVGSGISATNITTGTLSSSLMDADLQDLADGTLSDSKLEATIDRTNFIASGYVKASKFVDDDASYYADLNTGGNLGGYWGINRSYSDVGLNIKSGLTNILRC
ncbi:MAG: hypothetical protein KJ799_06595, partial [Bacteroidetes bacterium]|nr:hypothetical protein [Bacteroidota bacterium]